MESSRPQPEERREEGSAVGVIWSPQEVPLCEKTTINTIGADVGAAMGTDSNTGPLSFLHLTLCWHLVLAEPYSSLVTH